MRLLKWNRLSESWFLVQFGAVWCSWIERIGHMRQIGKFFTLICRLIGNMGHHGKHLIRD